MSKDVEIVYPTVQEIIRSPEVASILGSEAAKVADRANGMARAQHWGLEVDPYGFKVERGLGVVAPKAFPHNEAEIQNARHNTLLKALGV